MLPNHFDLEQRMAEQRREVEIGLEISYENEEAGGGALPNESLQYPIGRFVKPKSWDPLRTEEAVRSLEAFPSLLRGLVDQMDDETLGRRYRPGGWTARQVVHHLADSHMNSFIRMKLALTEERPVIKPYAEDRWALLSDTSTLPVAGSLLLIEQLHARWAVLLRSLSTEQWQRSFVHPESGEIRLYENAAMYAWHGQHHLEHIRLAAGAGG
ncbi:YfiT family bacillithiol transferase [Paenibacillus silviterrae]|uniref:YfiT family bacillithiol transferase n=1 Tax=Paenibacillus silviterrae TaxID=3242194 RepID=UPI002542A428|nr:putative metal-dependent hydrolase [Paenibacillus chinjuensis]